jgi:hypothetical protein
MNDLQDQQRDVRARANLDLVSHDTALRRDSRNAGKS